MKRKSCLFVALGCVRTHALHFHYILNDIWGNFLSTKNSGLNILNFIVWNFRAIGQPREAYTNFWKFSYREFSLHLIFRPKFWEFWVGWINRTSEVRCSFGFYEKCSCLSLSLDGDFNNQITLFIQSIGQLTSNTVDSSKYIAMIIKVSSRDCYSTCTVVS